MHILNTVAPLKLAERRDYWVKTDRKRYTSRL